MRKLKETKPITEQKIDGSDVQRVVSSYLDLQKAPEWKLLVSDLKVTIILDQARVIGLHAQGKHDEAQMLAAAIAARQWLIGFPQQQETKARVTLKNVERRISEEQANARRSS